MTELSPDDVSTICQNFLLASPPGEFMEVVTDVRGLVQNDRLINDLAPETFKRYNTEQLLCVNSPVGAHQVVISEHGEVGADRYLDPRGGVVLTFDHITQSVTSSSAISGELDADVEPYRSQIDDAVTKYVSEFYPSGVVTVYSKKKGGQFVCTICISASKYNSNNFWNGRWRSTWVASFRPGGDITVKADVKVAIHYYEDGNVQLSSSFAKETSLNGGNPGQTAAEVAKWVKTTEREYHAAVDNTYQTMNETTFKALRRVLPITKQRINWPKIKAMRLEAPK